MRAIVGREGLGRPAASTSQMGRFETEWLASEANPADPLFAHAAVKLEITAREAQAIRAAHERAISPVNSFRTAAVGSPARKLANRP